MVIKEMRNGMEVTEFCSLEGLAGSRDPYSVAGSTCVIFLLEMLDRML